MSIHAVSFKQITAAFPLDLNPAQLAQYFLVIWLLNLVCLFKCLLVLLLLILFSSLITVLFLSSFAHDWMTPDEARQHSSPYTVHFSFLRQRRALKQLVPTSCV